MDNAQKAIMIGVGLFITIIIISAVLLIVNLGTGLVDDATAELGTMSTSLQNQILQSYDNKVLSGVQVRSAIQQYLRSTDLSVVLCGIMTNGTDKNIEPYAVVGAKDFNVYEIKGDISGTKTKIQGITEANFKTVEGLEISPAVYTGNTSGLTGLVPYTTSLKKTSMSEFNNIENAGTVYINTAANYKSVILRAEGTDTVVGIVFVPYSN